MRRAGQQSRSAQAEGYLAQAAEALTSAGDPSALWPSEPRQFLGEGVLGSAQRGLDAANRRLRALRSSVIFSALAMEAYANDFLSDVLPAADMKAIERLATLDKLLLGPRLAGMQSSLERGAEPAQTIKALFRVRNNLVHANRSEYSAFVTNLTERDEGDLGPAAVGSYLRRTAEAVARLETLCPPPHLAGLATQLSCHPEVIDELVQQIGERIDTPVPEDARPPLDLGEAVERRAMKRGRRTNE